MYPTLQPGDNILVNKWVMGARIFDIWEAAEEKEVEIHRLPGLGKVKRNDVLVFHFPYPRSNDSLSMHLLKYYVKRCIALPGDTMGIEHGHYYIKGVNEPVGNVEAQKRISRLRKDDARGVVMDAYPWDKYLNWTIQDFGPLHVPARGQTVAMDSTAVKLYRKLIEWEQKKPMTRNGNKVYLGDSLIQEYRFKENYYFMGGDNMENSKDSRYWGLLPEPYIVGVATRINMFKAQQPVQLSDIAMANVEALADNEGSGLELGPYNIRERFTDEYYNGILYHQKKIVTCYPGGDYACKEGKYYRNKKENGQWGNWIPV